jgi:uncharacterized protein
MDEKIHKQIREIAEKIKFDYKAERVILFGSYARGEEKEGSDVDLFIIAPTKERFFQRGAQVRKMVRDLSKGIPFSPIVLNQEEVDQRLKVGDQFVRQILEQGKDL